MKVKVTHIILSVSGILYCKLIWIDEMQKINESRIVQYQNVIYIVENGIKAFEQFLIFIFENLLKEVCLVSKQKLNGE